MRHVVDGIMRVDALQVSRSPLHFLDVAIVKVSILGRCAVSIAVAPLPGGSTIAGAGLILGIAGLNRSASPSSGSDPGSVDSTLCPDMPSILPRCSSKNWTARP